MYLARPVQIGQHSPARNTSRPQSPPAPPVAPPPPPGAPQNLKAKSKPVPRKTELKSVFDRDKLLDEVRTGVKLRHTVTNDKSAPIGVGRVRSGGYSPPPDSTASTSAYSSRPEARKPVFYGQHIDESPPAPPPPKAPPPPALLKHSSNTNFDRDQLLSEIHGGVKLRKTITNDRSAPIGVGTVRNDLDLSQSPIPETSTLHLSAVPPPPPPPSMLPPPPPSPHHLSPQPQHKPTKPITNPALLKLGGKQPVNRDALLASIRGGVKLRKVGISDHSRDTSPDRHASPAPPPPPLFAPPPPPPPPSEPVRRSRSPNPVLMKLGGKVTVDRDELMRSIRQGVKLRKTVTNDKSSAIINDDDSGVKSPGRSSPSTSNYEDDVYGSQSLSDLSSIGTSRFSSLSNIPPERPNDLPFVSPALAVPETGTAAGATSGFSDSLSPTKSPSSRSEMTNVPIAVLQNSDEEVEEEPETVTLQLPTKRKVDESYSSPIPTREQIEAEIPTGSARDRIRMFGGAARETSRSPERSLSRPRKSEMEMNNSEFGVARMRELFKDTIAEKPPAPVLGRRGEEHGRVAAIGNGENSIKKMVRKFSTDDDSNKTSQPIWCQKKEEKAAEPEKKSVTVRRKASGTKGSIRRKSSTKESKARRKSSIKNESPPTAATTIPTKNYAAPSKPKGPAPAPPLEVEDEGKEKRGFSRWTPPKVDISKFRERFENHSQSEQPSIRRGSTSEEIAKPGRIKKPPWIKNEESESPPLALKTEEVLRPTWKKTKAPELPTESEKTKKLSKKATSTRSLLKQQESLDHEEFSEPVESPASQSDTVGVVKRVGSSFKNSEKAPPVPSSSPPKIPEKQVVHVPVIAEETTAPTREGVGPYRYIRKNSTTDKKPAIRKDSTSSKKNSVLGGGNLLNSVPKPFGTHLSTTGQTTTIDANAKEEEPKGANRQFTLKPKIQSKGTVREREEAFADQTTNRTAKKTGKTRKKRNN